MKASPPLFRDDDDARRRRRSRRSKGKGGESKNVTAFHKVICCCACAVLFVNCVCELRLLMLLPRCAESLSLRVCGTLRSIASHRHQAPCPSQTCRNIGETKLNNYPDRNFEAIRRCFAHSVFSDIIGTGYRGLGPSLNCSKQMVAGCSPLGFCQLKRSLRCFSSSSVPSSGNNDSGVVGPGSSATRSSDNLASVLHGKNNSSYTGRFQEEGAQSLDYDSTRIDLHKLISSPSDLKGLHATLQSSDKQIMSMTIEDIRNLLKAEFRRRASQSASVEIWKALLVVGGLLFVLYWGRIGKDIAGETARVTTLTLQDEQLQAKAFELANVIVRAFTFSQLCCARHQTCLFMFCRSTTCSPTQTWLIKPQSSFKLLLPIWPPNQKRKQFSCKLLRAHWRT